MKTGLTIENINTPLMLGVALRRHRKELGMSQDELAKFVNMRQATISDLENGRGTLESFFKMIQVLKINVVFSNQRSLKKSDGGTKIKKIVELLND